MDMNRGFFGAKKNFFHSYPPTGFAVIGYPHMGYLLSLEWIGRVHVALASQFFIIGSSRHQSEVDKVRARTKDLYAGGTKEIPHHLVWTTVSAAVVNGCYYRKVMWCKHEGRFFKRIRSSLHEPQVFRTMARVYTKLWNLWQQRQQQLYMDKMAKTSSTASASASSSFSSNGSESAFPSGLVLDCRLWYGSHEVLVDMAYIEECSEISAELAHVMLEETPKDDGSGDP
jgi:predicted secreted protein